MEQLQLYLDDLKQTVSGVDGVLCFTAEDLYFPCEDWREPVSVVLERWIPSFLSFVQDHTDGCLLEFMDGPYCMKLSRIDSGAVTVSFFRDSCKTGKGMTVDPAELIRSVRSALRTYDRTLYQWGMPSKWTKELSVLNQLMKQV